MATDQQVTARMVLEAQLELERRGAAACMQHLEKTEPELANSVLESLSLIYTKLSNLGGPPQKTKQAFRSVQTLVLVSIEALRRGHLELWEKQMGSALGQLDPKSERGDQRPES